VLLAIVAAVLLLPRLMKLRRRSAQAPVQADVPSP